ncbi:phage tail protein [Brevibacillus sp. SYSU BS000544]|uniref:phage tail protein n=1 Tax=Brevibacillus sp. SYSU BS000544 TaxID=3416443 RepID=UPI003CE5A48E
MSDQYLGEIRMFSGDYPPAGWAFCNGQELLISQNTKLYTLIGTTYGGDGQTKFNLPDLRGRIPIHMGISSLSSATYALGQKEGTETVTLTTSQIPAHTHTVNAQSAGTTIEAKNNYWATSSINQYAQGTSDAVMNAAAIQPAGGNLPHNNMMQFLAVNFIIALTGTNLQEK